MLGKHEPSPDKEQQHPSLPPPDPRILRTKPLLRESDLRDPLIRSENSVRSKVEGLLRRYLEVPG